jgi:hypothetical protein
VSSVDESALTRDGLLEAAAIVDRLANANPAGSKEREALLVGASLIRSHATRPDADQGGEHPALDRWFPGLAHLNPGSGGRWTYQDGVEALVAAAGTLAAEISKAAKAQDDHTRAVRRLTDAVNRSTHFR